MDGQHAPDAHILDAAVGLVATRGITALTMRRVAAAAEVSLAQVQYYFHTKAQLIGAVFERATTQFLASVEETLAEEPSLPRLRRLVWRWLPLDAEREQRARVWLAYAGIAPLDDALAAASERADAQLRAWFAHDLQRLAEDGRIRSDVIPDVAACQLLALIDGVTTHSLVLPSDARAVVAERCLGTWIDDLARNPGGSA